MKQQNTALFQGLTNRLGDPTGNIKEMLIAAFGTNKCGGPDTKKAAEKLGVNQRTVQRWIAGENRKQRTKPNIHNLSNLKTKARQAASTIRGRKNATQNLRNQFKQRNTAKITINGIQGPLGAGKGYTRMRTTSLEISGNDLDSMFDAYERGGDKGVTEWMQNHYSENYVPDWNFDTINKFTVN